MDVERPHEIDLVARTKTNEVFDNSRSLLRSLKKNDPMLGKLREAVSSYNFDELEAVLAEMTAAGNPHSEAITKALNIMAEIPWGQLQGGLNIDYADETRELLGGSARVEEPAPTGPQIYTDANGRKIKVVDPTAIM